MPMTASDGWNTLLIFDYVPASFSEPTTYSIRVAASRICRTDGGADQRLLPIELCMENRILKQFSPC